MSAEADFLPGHHGDLGRRCLVALNEQGASTPLFVAHGMQCDTTFARLLARPLASEMPVYGFQGIGLRGDCSPHATIEAMADVYLDQARRVQPQGPYVLAGFCAGGHIAMEMAHRLLQAGERVECLFLIDTPATAEPDVLEAAVSTQVTVARQRSIEHPESLTTLAGAPETVAAFGKALRSYVPRPYIGRAEIYANRQQVPRMLDPKLGWKRLLPLSKGVRQIALDREEIVRHRVPLVAKLIKEALSR